MTQIIINETTPVVVEVSTPGPQGSSGTAIVGTVTTGASGSAAAVTNSGTPSAAVFNFTIPKGDIGDVTPAATAAKNAAEAAAIAAAASEIAAETAEQAAEDSATAALASANQASASASTAGTKAQEATDSASTAYSAAIAANLSRNVASAASTNANNKAAAALASADTASTKAQEASASEVVASTKAQEAVVSATTATNKATEASASAASALSAQQVTTDNATLAIAQANIAGAKAAAANTSANDALVQASVATAQAAEATTQANTATTQAGIATTQATTATTQAGIASTQANTAIAQAAIATTKASEASVSASNSQGSASAALASQTASTASAAAANTSAGNASGSAASALAIYGTTAAQQAALTNAQSAASLAQGYALSASSAIQQDLSGVTAQALHRSPNAVTAMFVYDTSKDSDGGAWTERCQHTSWYNEALNGKWLGAHASEAIARNTNGTLGSETVTNGTFTAWTLDNPDGFTVLNENAANYVTQSTAGGACRFVSNNTANIALRSNASYTVGVAYQVSFDVVSVASGQIQTVDGQVIGSGQVGRVSYVWIANQTYFQLSRVASCDVTIDNLSIKQVTALTTASGDYYQSTVDGKFYRLWKNLLTFSNDFSNAAWTKANTTATAGLISETAITGEHYVIQAISDGNVFTVEVKESGRDYIRFFIGTSTATSSVTYRFSTNTFTGIGSEITATSEVLADGYVRIAIVSSAARTQVRIQLLEGSGTVNYAGDITKGVFARRAQAERGTTATTYEAKTVDGTITETFRGNKADFPRLAGIVAEAASVTIYDLTEAGRPMWMRFNANTINSQIYGNVATLTAFNGLASVGTNGGISQLNFPKDDADLFRLVNQGLDYKYRRLALRNEATGAVLSNPNKTPSIGNNTVNAVAMTVLPDAPVDAVTGLQVPTIAVATAGGVSVIQNNGVVLTGTAPGGPSTTSIDITEDLLTVSSGNTASWYYISKPGKLTANFTFNRLDPSNSFPWFNTGGSANARRWKNAAAKFDASRVGLLRHNAATVGKGVGTVVSNTFNTGHLLGDIKRCFLADVDVGSVSGPELVTNGDFSNGTTGWTADANAGGLPAATLSTVGGRLRVACGTGGGRIGFATQSFATVIGKTYQYRATGYTGTAGFSLRAGSTARGFDYVDASPATGVPYSAIFTATTTTTYLTLVEGSTVEGQYAEFDNISVQGVVADRSYKASAAPITGTLTKTQVAAASQLVAYSGFSTANYLREPYSADLDFGTGEWSASAWVNVPVTLPDANFPRGSEQAGAFSGPYNMSSGNLTVMLGKTFEAGSTLEIAVTLTYGGVNSVKPTLRNASTYGFSVNAYTASFTISAYVNAFVDRLELQNIGTATGTSITAISIKEIASAPTFHRAAASGPLVRVGVDIGGRLTATASDGTTTRTVTTTAAYNTATWLKARAFYTTDGTLGITVNGVEVAATRGTPLLTLNNSNAVLTIGNSYATDAPFPGSISLVKLSATVPTAEQSQWMYEQEKQMFRDGAQVCLPDAGSIVDLAYDDATDKWLAVSATNESEWSGLVRTSVTASPAGSYSKISAASGIQLQARTTTNPGVDVTIPSYGLREELVNRSLAAARLARSLVPFDYIAGFTANTTSGSTAITSAAGITYPVSYVGARVSGAGIPADTFVAAVSATTIYLTKAATATASAVQISFNDFILPVGYEAKDVLLAGVSQREGATQAFTRLFDGFKETIRFTTAPSNTAFVQIQATRSIQ